MTPLRIFIGYDANESLSYHVLSHSILSRATQPIALYPLSKRHLHQVYRRIRGPLESTDFSMTRFLVPYLCNFEGYAIFMDCDMLCRVDIGDVMLHVLADPGKAVYVCQHDYTPKTGVKFLGKPQTAYPRKNWSSFMAIDCARSRALTPEYVNAATGLELHRLLWAGDAIGSLPLDWNWLVNEYPANPDAKILHYTVGGPWFEDYRSGDHVEDWDIECNLMMGEMAVQ